MTTVETMILKQQAAVATRLAMIVPDDETRVQLIQYASECYDYAERPIGDAPVRPEALG